MTKPRILQIGSLTGHPPADAELAHQYDVLQYWKAADPEAFLREHADSIEVIATTANIGCKSNIIAALPKLRAICSWGVGYDSIDVEFAHSRKIVVSNTPDVLNDCVADLAWGLLIAAARNIAWGDRFVRANHWENKVGSLTLGTRVSGKKLGIVGLGRIGEAIAKRGLGFDMEVAYHNRRARTDVPYTYINSLVDLASWSDFLVIATVGGASTRGLINEDVLRALGPKGIVVNIARGTVIDEPAMVRVLAEGALGGAGLDVFDAEPKVPDALKTMNNVVLMPHVASATHETRRAMTDCLQDNLASYFATGKVITPVE
ncbi:2-hydroxyacid dehydrogenase [Zwartia sp.]|uniref:2-hydroxyacid dehydrogenase n=1 Tax=Zwartia sp. TaxID=2978004 RepID=UPI00271B25AD|nr:2-hydroxyacid dehydrogenase [Zwartia sp.]MDO9023791.1 2-hydroxyacid dehydrogenase [Zwartia sp.]